MSKRKRFFTALLILLMAQQPPPKDCKKGSSPDVGCPRHDLTQQ
jgi:hypothetical protein